MVKIGDSIFVCREGVGSVWLTVVCFESAEKIVAAHSDSDSLFVVFKSDIVDVFNEETAFVKLQEISYC